MRKVFASLLAAVMTVGISGSISGFAADSAVDITGISINEGLIAVEATNGGEDTRLTLTLNKISPGDLSAKDKLYAILQEDAEKSETITYMFIIPDIKEGNIPGTGTYQVSVRNTFGDGDSAEFKYADSNTVKAFIDELKEADKTVTDDLQACEILDDVIGNPAYEGVYFTIGMDYDLFISKSEVIQNDTLNVLHNDGIQSLDKDSLPEAFLSAFGVAAFNGGEKAEGISILNPTYLGKPIDEDLKGSAVGIMDKSYESGAEFATGFNTAYGLATINNSNINNIGTKLSDFEKATGLCSDEIDKVLGLGKTQQYKAFEYMLNAIDKTPVESEDDLSELLDKAYKNARSGGSSSAGGASGGGGGDGSGGNRTLPSQGSVSSAVGTGGSDDKYQPEPVGGFTDLMNDHWAAESILYLKNKGIVSGTDAGAFEPDRTVTREEFTKMVILAFEIGAADGGVEFTDVQSGAWYLPYIAAASENDIINGIGDNKFGIGQNISRQDMAVIIKRTADAQNMTLSQKKTYVDFADEEELADYAKAAVKALYEAGIVNGKDNNMFDPYGSATRAEAAKIIYEAIKGGM